MARSSLKVVIDIIATRPKAGAMIDTLYMFMYCTLSIVDPGIEIALYCMHWRDDPPRFEFFEFWREEYCTYGSVDSECSLSRHT